jgi:hypothetical protein
MQAVHKNLHILGLLFLSVTVLKQPFVTIIESELIKQSPPIV